MSKKKAPVSGSILVKKHADAVATMRRMVDCGATTEEIGRATGVTAETARKRLSALGLKAAHADRVGAKFRAVGSDRFGRWPSVFAMAQGVQA